MSRTHIPQSEISKADRHLIALIAAEEAELRRLEKERDRLQKQIDETSAALRKQFNAPKDNAPPR